MSYLIDKVEDIARRLKELEADQQLALTGSTLPEPKAENTMWAWQSVPGADYDPA